jgi:thymidylate synthase
MRGEPTLEYLHRHNNHIWDGDALRYFNQLGRTEYTSLSDIKDYLKGHLGDIYPYQWRRRLGADQLHTLVDQLKKDPFGRRHIICSWDPMVASHPEFATLPACHAMAQFYISEVAGEKKISVGVYIRSSDVMLGLPYNIASYAIMLQMIGYMVEATPDMVHVSLGDMHIYHNQFDSYKEILAGQENMDLEQNPRLVFTDTFREMLKSEDFLQYIMSEEFSSYEISDLLKVEGYTTKNTVKIPLSV